MSQFLPGRTAVLSPHLDDGVLSLGGAISEATRAGSFVRIVTVFGGDVASMRQASGWDSLTGFATEGEAVRARRSEDAEACAVVGAEQVCLSFSEIVYAGEPDEGAVLHAVSEAVCDVDALLMPGYPLIHRDHRWLCTRVLRARLPCAAVGLYVEQPYRDRVGDLRRIEVDSEIRELLRADLQWERARIPLRNILAKRRAINAYRSQLRPLELERPGRARLARMLLREAIHGGEAIAWVRSTAAQ